MYKPQKDILQNKGNQSVAVELAVNTQLLIGNTAGDQWAGQDRVQPAAAPKQKINHPANIHEEKIDNKVHIRWRLRRDWEQNTKNDGYSIQSHR